MWTTLSKAYPGWTLKEIKGLTLRERVNALNLALR